MPNPARPPGPGYQPGNLGPGGRIRPHPPLQTPEERQETRQERREDRGRYTGPPVGPPVQVPPVGGTVLGRTLLSRMPTGGKMKGAWGDLGKMRGAESIAVGGFKAGGVMSWTKKRTKKK